MSNNKLSIDRNPSQQDISWFLDLYHWEQLELTPNYQRNSIWGRGDKLFFLDTIFNNYPCPAIYMQKEINEGKSKYNVVDGKQRLQTIIDFFENRIALAEDFRDSRLKGKKWKDIQNNLELSSIFYNYKLTVEILSSINNEQWGGVFDRLNRNSKTLTDQELRHARHNGWLISFAEDEANEVDLEKVDRFWKNISIGTAAKIRRMKDIEFISILMLCILENDFVGFPQEKLNELYVKYDAITSENDEPCYEEFYFMDEDAAASKELFQKIKGYLLDIENYTSLLSSKFFRKKVTTHVYSLWCYFVMNEISTMSDDMPEKIKSFFDDLEVVQDKDEAEYNELINDNQKYKYVIDYLINATGAATEYNQRKERHKALTAYINS